MSGIVSRVQIVLQGEVGICAGQKEGYSEMVSSAPQEATIVVLQSRKHNLNILANIDDFIDVASAVQKIASILMERYNVPLFNNSSFKVTLFGGMKTGGVQKVNIMNIFKQINIKCEDAIPKTCYETPSQILVNNLSGSIALIPNARRDSRLEWLQLREYGEFYVKNFERPFLFANKRPQEGDLSFAIREADRSNESLSFMPPSTEELELGLLEGSGKFMLYLKNEREKTPSKKEIIHKMASYIPHNISDSDKKLLNNSIQQGQFNLLLRLCAADSKCINLFRFLLEQRVILSVDIYSKGEKSGTALDVAQKYNNQEAVNLLQMQLS